MGLVDHGRKELKHLLAGSEMDRGMAENVLQLLGVLAEQGHSGMSVMVCLSIFERLARFEPLDPLTGADDEWNVISPDGMMQNRRCGRVFKDSDGACYDIDGYVFEDPDGVRFTNRDSRRAVTFPYVPKTEYVKVDGDHKPLS